MQPFVRRYESRDLEHLYDICVRTGDAGGDARGTYSVDTLMGDLFAAPYAFLAPHHCYVLDDGAGRAVGYVVGCADTAEFVRRYRREWIPEVAHRCPPPSSPAGPDDGLLALHHNPERMLVPEVTDHPAHLHIDLLPTHQRSGWGRALVGRFLGGVRAAGAQGVHLGMLTSNTPARAFYDRLGFTVIPVADAGPLTFLGRGTHPLP